MIAEKKDEQDLDQNKKSKSKWWKLKRQNNRETKQNFSILTLNGNDILSYNFYN